MPTDLDYEGSVIWVECLTCGASRHVQCTNIPILGPLIEDKVHKRRLEDWLKLKSEVAEATRRYNAYIKHPPLQQIPRPNRKP